MDTLAGLGLTTELGVAVSVSTAFLPGVLRFLVALLLGWDTTGVGVDGDGKDPKLCGSSSRSLRFRLLLVRRLTGAIRRGASASRTRSSLGPCETGVSGPRMLAGMARALTWLLLVRAVIMNGRCDGKTDFRADYRNVWSCVRLKE